MPKPKIMVGLLEFKLMILIYNIEQEERLNSHVQ